MPSAPPATASTAPIRRLCWIVSDDRDSGSGTTHSGRTTTTTMPRTFDTVSPVTRAPRTCHSGDSAANQWRALRRNVTP